MIFDGSMNFQSTFSTHHHHFVHIFHISSTCRVFSSLCIIQIGRERHCALFLLINFSTGGNNRADERNRELRRRFPFRISDREMGGTEWILWPKIVIWILVSKDSNQYCAIWWKSCNFEVLHSSLTPCRSYLDV